MLKNFILALFITCVSANTYYVSPNPNAPYLGTESKPYRITDLPLTYTIDDQIIFLPGSATYSVGTKTFINPSATITPGCKFSASLLNFQNSATVSCDSSSFSATSRLRCNSVTNVISTNCNFSKSSLWTAPATYVTVNGGFFDGLTTTQGLQVAGVQLDVEYVTFTSSSTTLPPMQMVATVDEAIMTMNNLVFNGCNTTNGNSILLMNSKNGEEVTATINTIDFTNCYSGNAFLELRNDQSNVVFYSGASVATVTATGGSVKAGFISLTNMASNSDMSVTGTTLTCTGTNFNNGPGFTVSATGSGKAVFDGQQWFNNALCAPTNMANIVRCTGNINETKFFYAGYNEGATTIDTCTLTSIDTSPECGV